MIRSARRSRWRHVVLISLCLAGAAAAQPEAQDPFAAGSAAFAAGDYPRALELFQAARARGPDTPAIEYNLGVCQYRVGDYAAAEATFRALATRFPDFRALAEYNRGLALLALGRRAEALDAFGVARAEGDERLAPLAAGAIQDFGSREAVAPAAHWLGYLGLTLGHDDNVALVDQLSLPANLSADSPFTEFLGYASRQFGTRVPLRLELSGYAVRYADDHTFDQDSLSVDTLFQWSPGEAWRLEAGPGFASSTLDGDGFERTLGAQLRATRRLSERLAFDVRFHYDDIESPTARYDFVAGHRERLRFGIESRNAGRRLRAAYEIVAENRADPGVSPDRDRILLSLSQPLRGRWFIDASLSHRTSRYEELAVPRRERLVELGVAARRELRSGWFLDADYRWADNASNVAQFSYTSHRIGFGVSRAF